MGKILLAVPGIAFIIWGVTDLWRNVPRVTRHGIGHTVVVKVPKGKFGAYGSETERRSAGSLVAGGVLATLAGCGLTAYALRKADESVWPDG